MTAHDFDHDVDIVAFDPRGTGGAGYLDCGTDVAAMYALDPRSGADSPTAEAWADVARDCAEVLGDHLDDVSTAALSKLSAVDAGHRLGFFTGDTLEATLDTAEQGADGRRFRVRGMRPATDAGSCFGAVGARETLQEMVTFSAEQAVNGRGFVPANVSTRLARGRLRIPAATIWTFAAGVEPEFVPEGTR